MGLIFGNSQATLMPPQSFEIRSLTFARETPGEILLNNYQILRSVYQQIKFENPPDFPF